nr:hypothetical protein [uncultured Ruegeria sp.]
MSDLMLGVCIVVGLIVAAALIEAYLKRNKKRSLADMRPDPDEISQVGGIERYGLDLLSLAQAEHRRLEAEGWGPEASQNETTAHETGEEDKQDERR